MYFCIPQFCVLSEKCHRVFQVFTWFFLLFFLIIRWYRVITFSLASVTESALHEEFSSVVSHSIFYFPYILDGQTGQYSDFSKKIRFY